VVVDFAYIAGMSHSTSLTLFANPTARRLRAAWQGCPRRLARIERNRFWQARWRVLKTQPLGSADVMKAEIHIRSLLSSERAPLKRMSDQRVALGYQVDRLMVSLTM
jgi:hypothetical protein